MVTSVHTQKPLESAKATASEMARLAVQYSGDLGEKAMWPIQRFYDYVKGLEFRSDPKGHESIARPRLTMQGSWPWRDCDDKSILIGAWCFANKIPFHFQASSKAPSGCLHHVYVVARDPGTMLPVTIDATYPRNRLGIREKQLTKISNLTGEIMDSTLNIFEGDQQPLLGFSLRKMGRGIKKGIKKHGKLIAAGAAGGPVGIAAYKAYQHRGILHGEEEMYLAPELMGRSFLSRVARKAKKVAKKASKPIKGITHVVLRTPGLKDALAATVPGGSAMLAAARKVNKAYKADKPSAPSDSFSLTDAGASSQFPEAGMNKKKMIMIGGGVLALAAVYMIAKKKS